MGTSGGVKMTDIFKIAPGYRNQDGINPVQIVDVEFPNNRRNQ